MKKVIIIGATGSLAEFVIEAVKPVDKTELTLFVRDKKKLLPAQVKGCAIIEGDALDFNSLRKAISGQEIVYVNLAGDLETMITNIVKAMKETGVKRIIAVSSIGIYISPLRPVLVPYRKLADIIENSGLDYTILRPDWFTNVNEVNYQITQKSEPEKGTAVSRKSIAGGDYLPSKKKERMLIASAKSIIESNKEKSNELLNYSFNENWIIETANILDLYSKTDRHFPNVSVIVADSIDKSRVFIAFAEYYGTLNDTIQPIKKNFIQQTTNEERDYLNNVFFRNIDNVRFSANDGQYELFYPYIKDGRKIILYFSDYQRYGKIGS